MNAAAAAANITFVSGGTSAAVGTAVSPAPVVEVTDGSGNLVANETVTFSATAGGGSVSSATVTTDTSGRATVIWTLGTTAGTDNNTLQASIGSGASATLTASATAAAAPLSIVLSTNKIRLIPDEAMNPVVASTTGGSGPYTYNVSPNLPSGLVLGLDGGISGTPTASATNATYRVQAEDSTGATAIADIDIEVIENKELVLREFKEATGRFMSRRIERTLSSDARLYRLENRVPSGRSGSFSANIGSDETATRADLQFSLKHGLGNGIFAWVEGSYSFYDYSDSMVPADGEYAVIHAGADIQVSSNTVMGFMVSWDSMSEDITAAYDISGDGYLVGPYFATAISEQLFLSGRLAFGKSDNSTEVDINGTSYSGDFDTDRSLATLTLTGETKRGQATIRPEVSLAYAKESQDDYFVTDGTFTVSVPGQEVSAAFAKIATEVQLPFSHLGDRGYYYVRPSLSSTFSENANFLNSDLYGAIETGYHATPSEALGHGVSLEYFGIGDTAFEGLGLRAYLEFRF